MDPLTISAASGLRSRMESLDMLANNIANASTGGYKADREFYSLYAAPEAEGPISGPDTLPVIERPWTDFSQGEVRSTGNPLDVALQGKGFFSVNGPGGPMYTRDGSFHLSSASQLVTVDGYPVRGDGWESDYAVVRDAGGGIARRHGAPGRPDGRANRRGRFRQPGCARKNRAQLFPSGGGRAPRRFRPPAYEVQQGSLESSNASSAEAAVRLVSVMRQFEMLQKAAALGGEMNRKAVEEVARVSS